jgi:hypothetical protein
MTRVAADAFGFLIFSHAFDGPDLYGALSFFETMPSRPSLREFTGASVCIPDSREEPAVGSTAGLKVFFRN